MKIRAEINKIKNRCPLEKSNKAKIPSLKRLIKLISPWGDCPRKNEKTQSTNIRNQKGNILQIVKTIRG